MSVATSIDPIRADTPPSSDNSLGTDSSILTVLGVLSNSSTTSTGKASSLSDRVSTDLPGDIGKVAQKTQRVARLVYIALIVLCCLGLFPAILFLEPVVQSLTPLPPLSKPSATNETPREQFYHTVARTGNDGETSYQVNGMPLTREFLGISGKLIEEYTHAQLKEVLDNIEPNTIAQQEIVQRENFQKLMVVDFIAEKFKERLKKEYGITETVAEHLVEWTNLSTFPVVSDHFCPKKEEELIFASVLEKTAKEFVLTSAIIRKAHTLNIILVPNKEPTIEISTTAIDPASSEEVLKAITFGGKPPLEVDIVRIDVTIDVLGNIISSKVKLCKEKVNQQSMMFQPQTNMDQYEPPIPPSISLADSTNSAPAPDNTTSPPGSPMLGTSASSPILASD